MWFWGSLGFLLLLAVIGVMLYGAMYMWHMRPWKPFSPTDDELARMKADLEWYKDRYGASRR